MDHHDGVDGPEASGPVIGTPERRESHAAGRARTGDFEIFSLALSQTELPRLAADHEGTGQKAFVGSRTTTNSARP
jgi:hypothetical protein